MRMFTGTLEPAGIATIAVVRALACRMNDSNVILGAAGGGCDFHH
jgi:hypothetical protein